MVRPRLSVCWRILIPALTFSLAACEAAPPPTMLPTPPGTPTPTATPIPTATPTPTPMPTATPTPTPAPGEAERAALTEAAAVVGWDAPAFGEEPALPGKRAYHSWSVAALVLAGADRIMEIRQYDDDAAAARGLRYEQGTPTTFHRLPARRHQTYSAQYGRNAHLDTLVWQDGVRLFWVRDADNAGGLADALPLAEALRAAAVRHGLTAPPPLTVTRDLRAQGTASGFAVSLRVQARGDDLPTRVVVEERFTVATLADPLGAASRQEPDGAWVLTWDLQGDQVTSSELIYLVAVPCSVAGTFQAQGTVSFQVGEETASYPIGGDAARPVAAPTCTPQPESSLPGASRMRPSLARIGRRACPPLPRGQRSLACFAAVVTRS